MSNNSSTKRNAGEEVAIRVASGVLTVAAVAVVTTAIFGVPVILSGNGS